MFNELRVNIYLNEYRKGFFAINKIVTILIFFINNSKIKKLWTTSQALITWNYFKYHHTEIYTWILTTTNF